MFPQHLLDILACPLTKQPLTYNETTHELISVAARLAYPINDNIPVLLIDEARALEKEDIQT